MNKSAHQNKKFSSRHSMEALSNFLRASIAQHCEDGEIPMPGLSFCETPEGFVVMFKGRQMDGSVGRFCFQYRIGRTPHFSVKFMATRPMPRALAAGQQQIMESWQWPGVRYRPRVVNPVEVGR